VGERGVRHDLLLENGLRFHMQGKVVVEIEQKGLGVGIRYSTREKAGQDERRAKKRMKV
jgi:hypothetical protein